MRLNQIIALVQGKKTRATKQLTELHHGWKADRISGISRTYSPKEEDGDIFPAENKMVQVSVLAALEPVKKELADFYNIVATQERGNTTACADVVIDEKTILAAVPVSLLLFLEKQLIDLRTLITNLPTLPEEKEWAWDNAKNCWVSKQEQTIKTQKKIEPIVKYQATPEHPAQTDLITMDRIIGTWNTIHLSGALPKYQKEQYLHRAQMFYDAVKIAREEANSAEVVVEKRFGESVLDYLFKSE